ncbi:MAG TPA: hypothetical protein VEK07_24185 [Polyangiaceae bacterium]|nr:hypothetical protein [Polyangiaceae bacterium]
MNEVTSALRVSRSNTLSDRVRDIAGELGCAAVWARASGPHVLIGLGAEEAFARVTPLGIGAYGLSFRNETTGVLARSSPWDPVLLIDDLAETVEHALVGEGAITLDD